MSGFSLKISGLDKSLKNIDKLREKLEDKVSGELDAFGLSTVNEAKRRCPVDEGFLRNSITYARGVKKSSLTVEIIAAADYAAYVEFGTRKFAAAHVATLPAEWQTFAAQFKGGAGGTFDELVMRIYEWVQRKGIRSKPKQTEQGDNFRFGKLQKSKKKKRINKETDQQQLAYAIAVKIVRDGTPAKNFFVPAIENNKKELIKNLQVVLK